MLYQIPGPKLQAGRDSATDLLAQEFISLRDIRTFLTRHVWTILLSLILAILAGTAHVLTAEPVFTAQVQLVIDPESTRVFRQQAGLVDASPDNAKVESQIEFLRSERIALSVIGALNLAHDPEFKGSTRQWPFLPQADRKDQPEDVDRLSDFERLRGAIAIFGRNLSVRRVGQSYVIEVSFTSADPEKAARIANATADAYIADQLEAKSQAAKRGGQWLEERISELRKQLNSAARAAQEFRVRNNIVDAGSRGLLDDQQLAELNSQLVLARAKTAEAQARLDRIEAILVSGIPDAAVTEVLGNQTMSSLRDRYLNAATRFAELTSRYAPNHPAVVSLSNEMQEYKRAMADELRRIGEVYKSDAEVAKLRETQLSDELAKRVGYAATTKEAQITASELDTVAQTYRRMYESYLQTLAEAVQRESFPVSDARVLSAATKPLGKSSPRPKLVLALSTLVGGVVGVGLSVLRQRLDRSIRSPRQLRRELEVDCLGLVPRIRGMGRKPRIKLSGLFTARSRPGLPSHFRQVEDFPFSPFANTMRGVRTSIGMAAHVQPLRCLAITSLSPGEGKSTVASNLARLFAISGSRTLLIDGDLCKPNKDGNLAPEAMTGLLDVLACAERFSEATIADGKLPLDLLPAANRTPVPNSSDFLGSERMRQFLESARHSYDMIIIDLPAMKVASDARAISPFVDAMILVAEWGETPIDVLGEALRDLCSAQAGILGVVINKADLRSLRRQGELVAAYCS